ncbi:MAG: thiol-disulfide oxidoreductase DCC family protein [Draconibacterium sp.]
MERKKNIILFDGICNLCNRSVNFILKRDKKNQFYYVSLQSDEGKKLIDQYNMPEETDSVILVKNDMVLTESNAVIEIGEMLPSPWNWVVLLRILPRAARDKIYKWIARNRYNWFGKRESCRIIQN